MNKLTLFIFSFTLSLTAFAQSKSDAAAAAEEIKANTDYIYGEGWGDTPAMPTNRRWPIC